MLKNAEQNFTEKLSCYNVQVLHSSLEYGFLGL